jgi:hypothetical protein
VTVTSRPHRFGPRYSHCEAPGTRRSKQSPGIIIRNVPLAARVPFGHEFDALGTARFRFGFRLASGRNFPRHVSAYA